MKRILCILLLCWLPISISVAQVMSTQMMLERESSSDEQPNANATVNCHDNSAQINGKSARCSDCVSCALVTSSATFRDFISFKTLPKASSKYVLIKISFVSIQPPSIIKPPIFN